jgi:putative ABC transport system permease protein
MNLYESLRLALRSLRANKTRAALTVLGIIIGVAAVMSMLSIGRGARAAVEAQINRIGSNLLFIRAGSASQGGVNQGSGTAGTLTYEDAQALADPSNVPAALAVSPEGNSGGQVIYLANNVRTRITGAVPAYQVVHDVQVADGQFISDFNVAGRTAVVVLGATVATNLFQGDEPVGKSVRINGQPFLVLGVLQAQGGTGFGSLDDMVLVPLTTLQQRLAATSNFRGSAQIDQIAVKVANQNAIPEATSQIEQVLRQRHHVLYQDDFTIQSQNDILSAATATTNTFTLFLGGVAAISLIVGGIGIMNIMLVSVTERTREIGIRKAVGARRRDIQSQFLVEATVLSVLGGLLGVAVGFGFTELVRRIRIGGASITPVISGGSILLATIFSLVVGIFFGLYPASRAASLDPIQALRYE